MLLCIICDKKGQDDWPKKWQCWKNNGKFAEALRKLLGLPKYPYENDFQNSLYCPSCQRRLYGIYLIMRKWDKLQDDILKVKCGIENDLQKSLQNHGAGKGDCFDGKSRSWVENSNKDVTNGPLPSFETILLDKNEGRANSLRKRILNRLSKHNRMDKDGDCSCCEMDKFTPKKNSQRDLSPRKISDRRRSSATNTLGDNTSDSDSGSASSNDEDDDCSSCCSEDQTHHHDTSNRCCPPAYDSECTICNQSPIKSKKIHVPEQCDSHKSGKDVSKEKNNLEVKNSFEKRSPDLLANCGVPNESTHEIRDSININTHSPSITSTRGDVPSIPEKFLMDNFTFSPGPDIIPATPLDSSIFVEMRTKCYKDKCSRTFASNEELEVHVKRHHLKIKRPYECDQCDKNYIWKRHLDSHKHFEHNGKVGATCEECGRGFRTEQLLNLHVRTVHASNEERKYKCEHCEKSFISKSKLNAHASTHTKDFPFICVVCGKGFIAKTFLNIHMAGHSETSPYVCNTCGKLFTNPRNLQVHQYSHTQDYPYKCPTCQTGCSTKTLLKAHMELHTQEKLFTCDICDKKFRFANSLKKHKKIHEGDKRFKCKFCDKTFVDNYKLQRHLSTHAGEFSYECKLCQKKFNTKEYFRTHVRKHNGIIDDTNYPDDESFKTLLPNSEEVDMQCLQPSFFPSISPIPGSLFLDNDDDNTETERTDEFIATIELDQFTDPVLPLPDDLTSQQQPSLLDLSSATADSSFQSNDKADFFNTDFSSFPF